MGFEQPTPTELRVDNKGAVFTAKYAGHSHTKMKHVARRWFYIRELVQDGKMRVSHISADDNEADLFTKPIQGKRFAALRDRVMNAAWRRGA